MAGFEVTINGRFWVTAEGWAIKHGNCVSLVFVVVAVGLVIVEFRNCSPIAVIRFGRLLDDGRDVLLSGTRIGRLGNGAGDQNIGEEPTKNSQPCLEARRNAATIAASAALIHPRPRLASSSQLALCAWRSNAPCAP